MNRIMIATRRLVVLVLLLPFAVQADIINGTVTNLSATRNIPYTTPTSVSMRWSMLRFTSAAPPGVTVSSLAGTFTDTSGGIVLGTINKTLSRSIPLGSGDTFTFNETVRIPRAVLLSAFQQNIRTIFYRRDFTDCPGATCTPALSLAISYTVTGSAAGTFGVSGYSLHFSDDKLAALVQQGEKLQAEARINVTGTGTIKGVWEAASPGSTAGVPFYKTLQLVTRQVSSGQTFRLLSPVLPVYESGNYLVRFRFIEPGLSEEPPVLQYVVQQRQQLPLPTIPAKAPAEDARIDQDTVFQWDAVANAAGYKLEIVRDKPADDSHTVSPVTGILIKSRSNRGSLTKSLIKKLEAGQQYWWHVLALDADGNIIAASDWRRIRTAR